METSGYVVILTNMVCGYSWFVVILTNMITHPFCGSHGKSLLRVLNIGPIFIKFLRNVDNLHTEYQNFAKLTRNKIFCEFFWNI
jgi:hypothetical protein